MPWESMAGLCMCLITHAVASVSCVMLLLGEVFSERVAITFYSNNYVVAPFTEKLEVKDLMATTVACVG